MDIGSINPILRLVISIRARGTLRAENEDENEYKDDGALAECASTIRSLDYSTL